MLHKKWANCPKCGHKLFMFKELDRGQNIALEVKCHSCKSIIRVEVKDGWMEAAEVES